MCIQDVLQFRSLPLLAPDRQPFSSSVALRFHFRFKNCNVVTGIYWSKMASSRMHVFLWATFCLLTYACVARVEDNEFAEFEEDEFVEGFSKQAYESLQEENDIDSVDDESADGNPNGSEEVQQEEDEDEAEVEVEDEYEYEEDDEFEDGSMGLKKKGARADDIKLSSADVQTTHRVEEYFTELLVAVGLSVYLLNYMYGRSKNAQFAQEW